MPLAFREIQENDKQMIRDWFINDHLGSTQLGFCADPEQWLSLLNEKRKAWLLLDKSKTIGFLDIETADGTAYFAYYIAPAYRGHGFGLQALSALKSIVKTKQLHSLHGGVEQRNTASIKTLRTAGFVLTKSSEKGMLSAYLALD